MCSHRVLLQACASVVFACIRLSCVCGAVDNAADCLPEMLAECAARHAEYDERMRFCGPASVRFICAVTKRECPPDAFQMAMKDDGIRLTDLIRIADRQCQLSLEVIKVNPASVGQVPALSILILKRSHCVVMLRSSPLLRMEQWSSIPAFCECGSCRSPRLLNGTVRSLSR